MKQLLSYVMSIGLFLALGCAGKTPMVAPGLAYLVPAEGPIPNVPAEVLSSDHWIREVSNPDDLVLDTGQIAALNAHIRDTGDLVRDITAMPAQIAGGTFRAYIAGNARYLLDATFYITGDVPLEQAERARIVARMDTLAIPETIDLKFGMTLMPVMGRNWPTGIVLMSDPADNEFDQNVAALVDMATPVALVHTSHDGRWVFVQTPRFLCWLPASSVAFGDRATLAIFDEPAPPLVATGDQITVYASPDDNIALGTLGMGGALPLRTAGASFCQVIVPIRNADGMLATGTGYVRRSSDISIGYLPYTPRNVYRQAFVLYGARYGWGGMNGDRDCSAFIMDVFRCFGIQLPRNSTSQAQASRAVIPFEDMDRETRLAALRSLPGGISLLRLDGHIMLYLGQFGNEPYAIHDFWAWREPAGDHDDVYRAARVAVTDLSLGEGSARGSFLDRLTHATIIGDYIVGGE